MECDSARITSSPFESRAFVRFGQVTARSAASSGAPVAISTVPLAIMPSPLRALPRLNQPSPGCEEQWRAFLFSNRSEEHTSELQSQSNLACRLLLEKNNNTFSGWNTNSIGLNSGEYCGR